MLLGLPGWADPAPSSGRAKEQGGVTYLNVLLTDCFLVLLPPPQHKATMPVSRPRGVGVRGLEGKTKDQFWPVWEKAEFKLAFTKYLSSDGIMKTSGVTGSCA